MVVCFFLLSIVMRDTQNSRHSSTTIASRHCEDTGSWVHMEPISCNAFDALTES